jgi:hypothetical protein
MSSFNDARSVERPAFFDGQALFASDLDGIAAFHRSMRWLHNRSLHQVGIGNGLAVSGRRGDREVRVQPGYALDSEGREIVLLDDQVESVPPVAGERDGGPVMFDLVVSYPDDDYLEVAETRAGICRPRGAVRLRERPVLCWVRLKRDVDDRLRPLEEADARAIQAGLKIVLARAAVRECKLDADLSIAERRNARPARQPRIACGRADAEWEAWTVEDPDAFEGGTLAIGLRTPVDTSGAELRRTPCYSARVFGPRPLFLPADDDGDGDGDDNGGTLVLLDVPAFVQDPTPTGFECFVPVVSFRRGTLDVEDMPRVVSMAARTWSVTWLAVEG